MAIYRSVSMSFWTDSKVIDEFSPEDRYFYLYLFTNPHTNLAGCYEIGIKQMSNETGYDVEMVKTLLDRFENLYQVVRFNEVQKEVLLKNWYKFNWNTSEKFCTALNQEINSVKTADFKDYLINLYQSVYGIDTVSKSSDIRARAVTVTVTDTDTDTVINNSAPETGSKIGSRELKAEFEILWQRYPKKQGKDKAYGYYERARKDGTTFEEIEQGLQNYLDYIKAEQTDMQFVKMGKTFFSQHAWLDDWSIRSKGKSKNPFMEMLKEGDY